MGSRVAADQDRTTDAPHSLASLSKPDAEAELFGEIVLLRSGIDAEGQPGVSLPASGLGFEPPSGAQSLTTLGSK